MPFHPMANPDLAGIMMARGIEKLGDSLGKAAGGVTKAMMPTSEGAGMAKAFGTQFGNSEDIPSGMQSTDAFMRQAELLGLSDEQIRKYLEALQGSIGGMMQSQGGMGPREFGL